MPMKVTQMMTMMMMKRKKKKIAVKFVDQIVFHHYFWQCRLA